MIEASPQDQIIHIYCPEDAQAIYVDATPIDMLPGLYWLELWNPDDNVVYFGYKWLGSGTSLPTYDQVKCDESAWSHWVNKEDWKAVREAWEYGEPIKTVRITETSGFSRGKVKLEP